MSTLHRNQQGSVDPRFWRTELFARSHGGWVLSVDGDVVASTSDADLDNRGAKDWARRELGEGVDFVPILRDDLAENAIARGSEIDWCATPHPPLPDGAVDPAITRWRDDHEHLTREALAAYERGDLTGAGHALAHLDVLDDEAHRDTRNTPEHGPDRTAGPRFAPLTPEEIAALDEIDDEINDEEVEP